MPSPAAPTVAASTLPPSAEPETAAERTDARGSGWSAGRWTDRHPVGAWFAATVFVASGTALIHDGLRALL
jgi:hypothetical protein